jgi:hypothetical protein
MDRAGATTWALGILLLFVIIGIVIILILANNNNVSSQLDYPDKLDIVLIERGRNRAAFQIERIDRYMPWVNSIVVVNVNNSIKYPVTLPTSMAKISSIIPVLHLETDIQEDVAILENITGIYQEVSNDIMFFGDITFPIRPLPLTYMWSLSGKKRLFNYVHPDATLIGFEKYIEPSAPVSVINIPTLHKSGNLENYILSLSLSHDLVYSPTINKTIVLINQEYTDNIQIGREPVYAEFFMTVFIAPSLELTTKIALNQKLLDFLS